MFKKFASEAFGLSDIGQIVSPADYDKVDSDDYVFHEDDEKIFFVIKSKKDEYCFTNLALIHLDGDSALSSKRLLKRYAYSSYRISDVFLETAGTVDMDVEIKFMVGDTPFSIDVKKSQLESLKDLYKALYKISEIKAHNSTYLKIADESIEVAKATLSHSMPQNAALSTQFDQINLMVFEWKKNKLDEYKVKDFGFVFEKYINN
ncbi:protein of unknown function DUF1696 [Paenibacillus curdlanolyticus YK9]|uniref:YvbH-like oligomerisation region n=1 Tax=Paenibacillus curdlanolyticus YK9 TaxID=717606 RepID=E0IF78_9BACL|nr:PH domain-containing protein [Paenibacillus curdlanolyticus]EFM08854.1 protein of unknown function DUF1696 [Paenibacillus curdlanolyticus YK9]